MGLLTAKEAVELSGFEAALLLIDKEMREQCDKSLRFLYLRIPAETGGVPESQLTDIMDSLRHRGFAVEKQTNPIATVVTW